MRLVPLNSAKQGTVIAKTLYDGNGRVLLSQGVELSEGLLNKIRDNGIYTLYINDEYSQNEIDDIIKPELKVKAVKTIKDTYDSISKSAFYNRNKTQSAQEKERANTRESTLASIKQISGSIVEEVLNNKNLLINLVDIKNMDTFTYQHSLLLPI